MKKYELIPNDTLEYGGITLFRVRALKDFGTVKAGDIGGHIARESNLSQEGLAWVGGDAIVTGKAMVGEDAYVGGNAHIFFRAKILGNSRVLGSALIAGDSVVKGDAIITGSAEIRGTSCISERAFVSGNSFIFNSEVSGSVVICEGSVIVDGCISKKSDYVSVRGFGTEYRPATFYRAKDGEVHVICGCFDGNLEEFRKRVEKTQKGKIAKEYLMIADLMEYHFNENE